MEQHIILISTVISGLFEVMYCKIVKPNTNTVYTFSKIIPLRFAYWTSVDKINKYSQNTHPIMAGITIGSIQTALENPVNYVHSLIYKQQPILLNKPQLITNLYKNCMFATCVWTMTNINDKYNKFIMGGIGGFLGSISSQLFETSKTNNFKLKNLYNFAKRDFATHAFHFVNIGMGFAVLDTVKKFSKIH